MPITKVLPGGTILLGQDVCCDGFGFNQPTRVITHAHADHLKDFEPSLGKQEAILMLPATRDLVYAIKGSHLLRRRNLLPLDVGQTAEVPNARITFLHANHILGSGQVIVEMPDGKRVGYTGDFWWPIEVMTGLDELVIDATYGNPDYIRNYTEERVVAELQELVEKLVAQKKRVCIKAVAGRLQYVMQLLQPRIRLPFIASKKQCLIAGVYRDHGCLADPVLDRHLEAGQKIIADNQPYIAFHHIEERIPETDFDAIIIVSAFMVPREEPIVQFSPKTYRVALTDHADFNATIEYVEKAAPKLVITDNSRGGDARTLADEIRERLKIDAIVGG
jgi:putative mRNA 3-end processing factor